MSKVKRVFAAAVMTSAVLLGVPGVAIAAYVSANCGSGGYFYTTGTADNWQDHYYGQSFEQFRYSGRQYRSKYWGYVYGWQGGEVYGTRLIADAVCYI